jgi:hypothetical protein
VRKASNLDRAIDDLVLKKYGNGHIYYGERARLREGEDPDEMLEESSAADGEEDELLKENAVLVVGGTGRTGQWVTLGLINQGFNVRVLTRKFGRAEALFGPSGSNVDVFQGDLSDPATLMPAVDGAVAVVIAAAPEWWKIGGSAAVEGAGAASLIEAAAAPLSGTFVKRVVLISTIKTDTSKLAASKAVAEKALLESGLNYMIVRVPKLSEDPGGTRDIIIRQETSDCSAGSGSATGMTLARVDAAQIVCQCLVYDRMMTEMATSYEPEVSTVDNSMQFGSVIVDAFNGTEPAVADKNYWKRLFAELQEE